MVEVISQIGLPIEQFENNLFYYLDYDKLESSKSSKNRKKQKTKRNKKK